MPTAQQEQFEALREEIRSLRKRVAELEGDLRLANSRFEALVDSPTDLVGEYTSDGRFRYASPNHREILGYTPEELIGTDGMALVHPDDLELTRRLRDRLMTGGKPTQTPYRMRHKNGEWRWFQASASVLKIPGAEGHLLAVLRDVTEQQRSAGK